jgi:hypothetical protein
VVLVVIHGEEIREIGKVYHEHVAGPDLEWHMVAYKVIAEATLEDFKKHLLEVGYTDTVRYGKRFYFVEMD